VIANLKSKFEMNVVDAPLTNIAHDIGEERLGVTRTAVTHFNKFLLRARIDDDKLTLTAFNKITNIDLDEVTPELMGKFGDYLHRVAKIRKVGTAHEYLGAVKCSLVKRFPTLERSQFAGSWYTSLRNRIDRLYVIDCKTNGTRKKDSAPTMQESDLKLLSAALIKKNTREADKNRTLFVWQWQGMGRISEICGLKLQSLKDYTTREIRHAICFLLIRTKTLVETDLLVFLHADTWEICPFHSLATTIVTTCPTDALFPQIAERSESEYVNRVLAQLLAELAAADGEDVDKLTQKLLSHSTRSGSASHANAHSDVQTSWVVLRGGWTLDGLQTVFNYLCGSAKTDSKVGRALSGWPSAHRGGNCPSEECIPVADRAVFKKYSASLMAAAPVSIRHPLMCSLLLRWDAMHAEYPEHNLFTRMLEEGRKMRVTIETIHRWVKAVKASFHKMNAPFLPVSELDDGDSVPYSTMKDYMDKSVETLNLVLNRTLAAEEIAQQQSEMIKSMNDRMESMANMIHTLLSGNLHLIQFVVLLIAIRSIMHVFYYDM
jgi:integrase